MSKQAFPLVLIVILLCGLDSFSQIVLSWEEDESPTSEALYSIDFLYNGHAIAVGANGTALYLEDHDSDWITSPTTTGVDLHGCFIVNESLAWAVGDDGTILKSTDAGQSWSIISSPTDKDLASIYFKNENCGFAAGSAGMLLITVDGGESWTEQSPVSENLSSVHFMNQSVGFITGENGTLLKTTDGGSSWQTFNVSTTANLNDVTFCNDTTGYVAGDESTLLKTTDFSGSWETVEVYGDMPLKGIAATDYYSGLGVAASTEGRSADRTHFEPWHAENHDMEGSFHDVACDQGSQEIFYMVGDNGAIFKALVWGIPSPPGYLEPGYQFISGKNEPGEYANMLYVLYEILDNLEFVRNTEGEMVYQVGDNWVNNIGDWQASEAYLVKMNANDEFYVLGPEIDPFIPVPLEEGYTFVGYQYAGMINALDYFESILNDNLDFIRDSEGQMIFKFGDEWINSIGDAMPYEGYLIRMNAPDTLI